MKVTSVLLSVLFAASNTVVMAAEPRMDMHSWIQWDTMRNYARNVANTECRQDILDTIDEANIYLDTTGLSDDFFAYLDTVVKVSGNDETANLFRSNLVDVMAGLAVKKRGYVPHVNGQKVRGVGPPVMRAHRVPDEYLNMTAKATTPKK
ncbi:hypothetical protein HDU80_007189 [Chytriomyces hyalinus]|nr:hypothetical protein HDU80_007189 [Chytriomyces hyalinus]